MADSNSDSEVLSYCGSCKMDLMATVIAKVGSKIAKVLCKTCKKERAYKPPKGVTEPGQAAARPSSRRKSAANSDDSPKKVPVEEEWTRLMGEAAQANRVKYSPKSKLTLGDVIQHPTFGDGIVTKLNHPDKAEVLFKTDLKMLIHSRS